MARRTDKDWKLPPTVSRIARDPLKWGTAKQTFLRPFQFPKVEVGGGRPGTTRADYRGEYIIIVLVTVYSTVH